MSRQRISDASDLSDLYATFLAKQSEGWRAQCASVGRERQCNLDRLRKNGVLTVRDLLDRLPHLPLKLQHFGIHLLSILKIRQAIAVLWELMDGRDLRIPCAVAINFLNPNKDVRHRFLEIGGRELEAEVPDVLWLEAVIHGLSVPANRPESELFVAIFERPDLPGWLRGDAADKLGCCSFVRDRRTSLFRRCCQTAIAGLDHESIEVQFWSMYLIGSLCCYRGPRQRTNLQDFEAAVAKLRRIAAKDQRLAPGYWWPMSAEAEDILCCIATGNWPNPDAADRWQSNTERGKMERE